MKRRNIRLNGYIVNGGGKVAMYLTSAGDVLDSTALLFLVNLKHWAESDTFNEFETVTEDI